MWRSFCTGVLALASLTGSSLAGDHFFLPTRHVIYAAPVAWQPAYVVPTSVVTVHQTYPVSTMTYATDYFAPMVPVVASPVAVPVTGVTYGAAPMVVVTPATYAVPVYVGRGFRSVRMKWRY